MRASGAGGEKPAAAAQSATHAGDDGAADRGVAPAAAGLGSAQATATVGRAGSEAAGDHGAPSAVAAGIGAPCGLPQAMLMDHGTPWWNPAAASGWTELTVWLMRQGIQLHYGRLRHPQTQGKVERFNGALEMARRRRGLPPASGRQQWLDEFRYEYNHIRPHEALAMRTPASVWRVSVRRYDPQPPAWDYGAGAEPSICKE